MVVLFYSYGDHRTLNVRTHAVPTRRSSDLKAAAAARWGVPVSEVIADDSVLNHQASDRKLRYGDVVTDAAKLTLDAEPPLKTPAEWTFLGKAAPSKLHIPEVVTGRAVFGLDVKLPGMVHAALMQAPVHGGSLKSHQPKAEIGRAHV